MPSPHPRVSDRLLRRDELKTQALVPGQRGYRRPQPSVKQWYVSEYFAAFFAAIGAPPQPREAHGGAQHPPFGLLRTDDREGRAPDAGPLVSEVATGFSL
jgi:hypothetical protein